MADRKARSYLTFEAITKPCSDRALLCSHQRAWLGRLWQKVRQPRQSATAIQWNQGYQSLGGLFDEQQDRRPEATRHHGRFLRRLYDNGRINRVSGFISRGR